MKIIGTLRNYEYEFVASTHHGLTTVVGSRYRMLHYYVWRHVSCLREGCLEGLRHQGGSSDPAAAAHWPTLSSFKGF